MGFENLGLGPEVVRAVTESGYTQPTPIQEQAIPSVLQGRDILGIAQTGTGKTAAFTLPMIDILAQGRSKARMPRSLILAPTRELADQVAESFVKYGKYHKLTMALLIGGVSFVEQNEKLDRGVDVLIATPGRLLDQIERGKVMLMGVQIMVIDEADRMLDMGFIPDVEKIFKKVPRTVQTLFFSATMAPEITRLTQTFLKDPKRIEVARQATAAEAIEQAIAIVDSHDKRDALRQLLRSEENLRNAIIFCNRKRDVDIVAKSLKTHGFNAAPIHGDLTQDQRTTTLAKFKSGEIPILVASDVAARGLDISEISHVINFDVPIHSEDYVHRIGRTGRAGRSGKAFTLASPSDERFVAAIEKLMQKPIPVIEIEGVAAQTYDAEGDGPRRRGRGPKKPEARGKAESREKPESLEKHARADKPEPAEKPARAPRPPKTAKPETGEAAEKPVREPRKPREDRSREDRPREDRPRDLKPRDDRPRRREDGDNDTPVLAFGDHLPAFMQRR